MSGTRLRRGGTGRRYLPGAQVGEEPACRWPEPSLVAVAWASDGAEAWGPRGGGTSPCQRGGRARPSLLVCVGAQVLQYLVGSLGISLELWSRDGAFSMGVHHPRRYPSCARVLVVLVMLYVWHYSGCISDNIRRCTNAWDDLLLLIECMLIWILIYFMIWFCLLNAHVNMSRIRYFKMYILCCSNRICACPSGRSCLQVTPPSGLCFAGVLIHFRSGKFQALDMSYFSKGHAGFFREFWHDLCQNM